MNNHPECRGCKYNTPKTQGGSGKLCNGFTQPARCPEWVINETPKLTHKERLDFLKVQV